MGIRAVTFVGFENRRKRTVKNRITKKDLFFIYAPLFNYSGKFISWRYIPKAMQ